MGKLDGKVAIVAGSSRGIGKGIALAYGREGARVAVVARSETEGSLPGTIGSTAAEIQAQRGEAIPIRCDITDEGAVSAMTRTVLDRYGPIDILVNSAVIILYTGTMETPTGDWAEAFDVNVKGAFLLTKAVLPGMIERRSGNIIHLTGKGATDATLVKPGTGATKAALEQFVRGTALEVAGYNVAVNCLDPGGIRTERGMARTPDRDWTGVAVPADVGPSAVHLACQDASSMTGQVFRRVEFDG